MGLNRVCLIWLANFSFAFATPEHLAEQLLEKPYIANFSDGAFGQSKLKKIALGSQIFVRATPTIEGIEVEGADRIFSFDNEVLRSLQLVAPLRKEGQFLLSHADAFLFATKSTKWAGEIPKGKRVWLNHFGTLKAAYRVRVPGLTLAQLKDVWVNAETGEILKIASAAKFGTAPTTVFRYSPSSIGSSTSDLEQAWLEDIVSPAVGQPLRGEFIEVGNCCTHEAPGGGCAFSGIPSRRLVTIPKDQFGLSDEDDIPDPIYFDTVACNRKPSALPNTSNSEVGYFATPVDGHSAAANFDDFSTIQAQFTLSAFFQYIRQVTKNDEFCLTDMGCSEGQPLLHADGQPIAPFAVWVNQLVPDLMLDEHQIDLPDSFVEQLKDGRGTENSPVVVDRFARVANAAFVTGISPESADEFYGIDERLGDLIRPYNYLIFFQGERDFAYDGDVLNHEFGHAVTATLAPGIATYGVSPWGIHNDGGSLDECWSDYFAASFTNSPQIGEYAGTEENGGETELRNLDNDASCPGQLVGEVHKDSEICSGALWEIRQTLLAKHMSSSSLEIDHVFMSAIADAPSNDHFESFAKRVTGILESSGQFGEQDAQTAQSIFERRGLIGCERAVALTEGTVKRSLILPSAKNLGIKNFAPAQVQLKIEAPPGTTSFKLTWQQYLFDGSLVGTGSTVDPEDLEPIELTISKNEPVEWNFKKDQIEQKNTGTSGKAKFAADKWQYMHAVNGNPCSPATFYVSPASRDEEYLLRDIAVEFEGSQASCPTFTFGGGCTCSQNLASNPDPALFALLFALFFPKLLKMRSHSNSVLN